MQKYTLKERKKNGVIIRLTGNEWDKIATLNDGEWTTHNVRGEAIGVRYGSTIHIHKDGCSGEFRWADLNCPEELDEHSNLSRFIEVAVNVAVWAVVTTAIVALILS